ncbi:MAG: rhomboid family intramembrane serine protease [Flavobacteriales bacterium]|nr:rhomboid family intramembrane serine protease [Flavobacteriales bacterium]
MDKLERNKFLNAVVYPVFFILIIGLVHLVQHVFEVKFTNYGIYPRDAKGLIGIITSPLVHGSFSHLFNNSIPILILGSALFYFYKEIAFKVSVWVYLMVGIWTWIYAREAYHIGASGLLYGLFSFLLISGFIRRNAQLISLSFAVIFLYGSLVWGVFPIDVKISFEGHLWGFVAGIVLAIYYRKQGPQKTEHKWEEEDDLDDTNPYWKEGIEIKSTEQEVNYIYKPNEPKDKAPE